MTCCHLCLFNRDSGFITNCYSSGLLVAQSTTPDKSRMDTTAVNEHKAMPPTCSPGDSAGRLSSSASSSAKWRLARIHSPTRLSPGKRVQSSAAKRLQYTLSQGSENGNGVKSSPSQIPDDLQALTTVIQRSPVRSSCHSISSCRGDATDSNNAVLNGSPEVKGRSAEVSTKSPSLNKSPTVTNKSPKIVTNRSPKVIISRSPKVTSRSPSQVNRSPSRQRQSVNGGSGGIKRGILESPAGQPKTKKYIVERLRNAKTSRKRMADAAVAGNKVSPSRKSPQRKSPSESKFVFISLLSSSSLLYFGLIF